MSVNLQSRTSQFIEKALKIHGNKFDYSQVEYVNSKTKVCIVCNSVDEITGEKHNGFWQVPYSHLSGSSCSKCSKHYMNQEIFIKRAKVIHNNKYDYSKVEYKAAKTKVSIICPYHREFFQAPDGHLNGAGCLKCSGVHIYNTNEWIEDAKKVHGEKYDYSKVEYFKNSSKISIICKEHGVFSKTPNKHLGGQGCPLCGNESGGLKNRLSNEVFLKKAFTDEYEYVTEYVTAKTKIHIKCKNVDISFGKKHLVI
jgi:hypothetical protein